MKKKIKRKRFDLAKFLADIYYPVTFVISSIIALLLFLSFGISSDLFHNLFIYAIPAIYLFFSTINFLHWLYAWCGVKYTNVRIEHEGKSNYIIIYQGEPGTGKSSFNTYSSFHLSKMAWKQLKIEYALLIPFEKEIMYGKDKIKKENLIEVKKAFEFWAKNEDSIPCLRTNFPVEDFKGRRSEILTKEHLEQKKPLLFRDVVIEDEFGSEFMADNKRGESKNLASSDQSRFTRQWTETHIGGTEQDASNIAIDIRRCVAINRKMNYQKAILKPRLITFIYNCCCEGLIKKFNGINAFNFEKKKAQAKAVSKLYIKILLFILRFLKASGFRKYSYTDRANLQTGGNINLKEQVIQTELKKGIAYVPSLLNCKYDDRAFRLAYRARNMEVKSNRWKSLVIDDEEILKHFMRDKKAYEKKEETN